MRQRKIIIGVLIGFVAVFLVVVGVAAFMVTQPFAGKAEACAQSAIEPAKLEAHVRALVSGFGPRGASDAENLARIAQFLETELARTGARVEQQPFDADGRRYSNVIARYGPTDGPRVVVGAHYDAHGGLPGADDNASGVAGLLELGRRLGENSPQGAVELVAYTLEEPPYFRTPKMGSAVHAKSLVDSAVPVRAMISIEMIGYYSDEPGSQKVPHGLLEYLYPDKGDFIAVVGRLGHGKLVREVKRSMAGATELSVYSLSGPSSLRGVDFSDHLNYWARGMDAVMVTDSAFFRNPNYHTANDTPESLDYGRMAQVVRGVECAVRTLASPGAVTSPTDG